MNVILASNSPRRNLNLWKLYLWLNSLPWLLQDSVSCSFSVWFWQWLFLSNPGLGIKLQEECPRLLLSGWWVSEPSDFSSGIWYCIVSVLSMVPRLNIRNSRLKSPSPSESTPDFTRIHRRSIESPCDYVPDLYHHPAFRVNVPAVHGVCWWPSGNAPVLYDCHLFALGDLVFLPISPDISVVKRKSSWISPELFSISRN